MRSAFSSKSKYGMTASKEVEVGGKRWMKDSPPELAGSLRDKPVQPESDMEQPLIRGTFWDSATFMRSLVHHCGRTKVLLLGRLHDDELPTFLFFSSFNFIASDSRHP